MKPNRPRAVPQCLILPTAAGLLCAGGCANVSQPTVTPTGARVVERTPDGSVVQIELVAENPNNTPLPLREVHYSVDVGGERVYRGTRSAQVTIPSGGTQTFTVPAPVAESSAASLRTWRIDGRVTYTTPGQLEDLLYDIGLYRPSTPIDGEGTLEAGER